MMPWFNEGLEHRQTGAKSSWATKPRRLQIAIILAANRLGMDVWDLVKPEWQARYLDQADRLTTEGVCSAREGGLQRETGATPLTAGQAARAAVTPPASPRINSNGATNR